MNHDDARLAALIGTITEHSTAMVAAAERMDWQELAYLGERYCAMIAALPVSLAAGMPKESRAKLAETLRVLLANEEQIRASAEPWLGAIKTLLAALQAPHRAA